MAEEWRTVPGFEGFYEVSDQGAVRSVDRAVRGYRGRIQHLTGRRLRPYNVGGYLVVELSRDGRARPMRVSRLVLASFVGPCPSGMEACHNDGDSTCNALENLRWDTHGENLRDKKRHGSITNQYSARSACIRGHEFTKSNLLKSSDARRCRACTTERNAASREGRPFDSARAQLRFEMNKREES